VLGERISVYDPKTVTLSDSSRPDFMARGADA